MVNEDVIICLLDMFSASTIIAIHFRDDFDDASPRPPFFYFYNALSTQGKNGVRGRQGHLEHEEEKTERN